MFDSVKKYQRVIVAAVDLAGVVERAPQIEPSDIEHFRELGLANLIRFDAVEPVAHPSAYYTTWAGGTDVLAACCEKFAATGCDVQFLRLGDNLSDSGRLEAGFEGGRRTESARIAEQTGTGLAETAEQSWIESMGTAEQNGTGLAGTAEQNKTYLTEADRKVGRLMAGLREDDLLVVAAISKNDSAPLFLYSRMHQWPCRLEADIPAENLAATIADNFCCETERGDSLLPQLA